MPFVTLVVKNLLQRPARTLLTALGVAVGVAAIVGEDTGKGMLAVVLFELPPVEPLAIK